MIALKNTKKAKYLLVDNNTLLGNKVDEILKRTYKIRRAYCGPGEADKNSVDLADVKRLISLAIFEQVNGIILDAEVFLEYLNQEDRVVVYDYVQSLIENCVNQNIKLIFLVVKYPMTREIDKYIDKYQSICTDVCTSVRKMLSLGTIFYVDSVYGEGNSIFVNGQENVLCDTAALFIADHIQESGEFIIKENPQINGKEIVAHQEKCVFKIVYKMKAQDFYRSYNIATLRLKMGRCLATSIPEKIKKNIDYVVPVPKTGMYYAMGLAEELNKPYLQALLKNTDDERSFQLANADERKRFLWQKLYPIKELLKEKRIAVVDEAIFTGATLKVVCEMLWDCGVKEIYLCIPTPKCRYHCDYLVHPPRPMLLEYINEGMLEKYFNVNKVCFQSDEVFKKLMEEVDTNMCADCYWGGRD